MNELDPHGEARYALVTPGVTGTGRTRIFDSVE